MHSLKKGFSLIELLVVIAIIGILAAVGTTGYQVYIDSTKLAVVKNNAATLLQAVSNEDMAQSAGVGGYAECDDKDNLPRCVTAILAASTLSNPYQLNARYKVESSLLSYWSSNPDAALNNGIVSFISLTMFGLGRNGINEYCSDNAERISGMILLLVDYRKQQTISAAYCDGKEMREHTEAGSKKLSFFLGEAFFLGEVTP